jgi:multidrug resistance efflux pump
MAQPENNHDPISTPFPLLVRRFRYQVLPALTMVAALVAAGWLYILRGGAFSNIGEVNIIRSTVTTKVDGMLAQGDDAPGRTFQVHDTVRKGELVARLDPRPLRAEQNRYAEELRRLEEQLGAVTGGAATRPAGGTPGGVSDITALRIAIAAAEGKLRELEEQLQHLDITAPIDGTITSIRAFPGQAVRVGDPIMTIASDQGQFIVSYIRTNQAVRPEPNMLVDVRVRSTQTIHSARVISIGPQVEMVPEQQCRDPRVPEWGLPVHVTLPHGVALRPGEIVDLIFHPGRGAPLGEIARGR